MDFNLWSVYLVCAVLGGTVMIIQFVMTLLGLGSDHDLSDGHDAAVDVHHDVGGHHHGDTHGGHGSAWYFGMLSFRALSAAFAFFGLVGLGASQSQIEEPLRLLMAIAAGVVAMFLVAWVMRSLARLRSEGTVRIDRAVGATAQVYLTIPPNRSGAGKVTVIVQNRTMEYEAVTAHGEPLPTGAKVRVVAVVSPGTLEVAQSA